MTFGKFNGADVADIPDSYLEWVLATVETLQPVLRRAIEEQLSRRAAVPVAMPRDVLKSLYREMSRRYHPDHGGSHEAMIAINDMYSRLQEIL
jgi:hypothetical protein